MKKLLLISFLFFGFFSCDELERPLELPVEESLDDGVIIGYDLRFCPCCGGYFVEIQNDTFRIQTFPDTSFQINGNELPLEVLLDWSIPTNQCLGDEIEVTTIIKK